jgi:hypothetical protein
VTAPGFVALWRWRTPMAVLLLLAAGPIDADAQIWIGSDAPQRGSVEISGGVVALGGFDMGSRDAEETRNINTGTGSFTLFTADSRIGAAPGAQLRVGVYLSKAISIETGVQYARPTLSSTLTSDAEDAPDLTAEETTTRYLFEGSLVLHLTRMLFAGGRGVPFLSGGGGYLRELHERNEYIETGREYHATAGLKVWFGRTPRVGLRVDAGASIRDGGADFRSGRRTVPTAGVSLAYLF